MSGYISKKLMAKSREPEDDVIMGFIKVTNQVGKHVGMPLLINTDWITTVFEEAGPDGGSLSTMIYCVQGNKTWIVEESLSQVIKKITEATTPVKACTCP
jgi:uncharacterized protein YlzI (FlbEa/FlbD family)